MKKLIAILLMLTLIVSLPCLAFAETAPDADPDAPVDNTSPDGAADDSIENGSNGEIAEDNSANDTKDETEMGGANAPENEKKEFKFEPAAFAENLEYMGVGMVGIFLVIGIIILCTVALNRIFSGKAKE